MDHREGAYITQRRYEPCCVCRAQDGRVIMENSDKTLPSAGQQSDSVTLMYILLHILFHSGLSQDIKYSSLNNTLVGPCCLSTLYIIVCIC